MILSRLNRAALRLQRLARVRTNEDGTTAIEFAIVAMPFLMLLFGIMSVSLAYFWIFTLENAVWSASRDLRTGAYQTQSSPAYKYSGTELASDGSTPAAGTAKSGDDLKKAFKSLMCAKTVSPNDCNSKAIVLVKAKTDFGDYDTLTAADKPNCRKADSSMKSDADAWASFDAGAASSVVVVTACYPWGFGGKLPFLSLGNMPDGSFLLQATSTFRTEPYN